MKVLACFGKRTGVAPTSGSGSQHSHRQGQRLCRLSGQFHTGLSLRSNHTFVMITYDTALMHITLLWQDDMMGVVRFIDECLERILYTSDQP